MSAPKWSILILTQQTRERFLARLKAVLQPQLEDYPDVEFVTRMFDKRYDLGTNRQAMIDVCQAEYLNFLDDDDLVPASYISTIYPLLDGVDYIGFRLQLFVDGVKQQPTFHSLRYSHWISDDKGYYRDISHLNPIRRQLAMTVKMSGGFGEDARWADALRAKQIVKTEHFIDSEMYFYYLRTNKNDTQPPQVLPMPTNRTEPRHDTEPANFFPVGHMRPICPKCGATCCGIAGGMRHCNQCGSRWV